MSDHVLHNYSITFKTFWLWPLFMILHWVHFLVHHQCQVCLPKENMSSCRLARKSLKDKIDFHFCSFNSFALIPFLKDSNISNCTRDSVLTVTVQLFICWNFSHTCISALAKGTCHVNIKHNVSIDTRLWAICKI